MHARRRPPWRTPALTLFKRTRYRNRKGRAALRKLEARAEEALKFERRMTTPFMRRLMSWEFDPFIDDPFGLGRAVWRTLPFSRPPLPFLVRPC